MSEKKIWINVPVHWELMGEKYINWVKVEARLAEITPEYEALNAEADAEYERMKREGWEKKTLLQGEKQRRFSELYAEKWKLIDILNLPGGRLYKPGPYVSPCLGLHLHRDR